MPGLHKNTAPVGCFDSREDASLYADLAFLFHWNPCMCLNASLSLVLSGECFSTRHKNGKLLKVALEWKGENCH